jgi:hypothetical protein
MTPWPVQLIPDLAATRTGVSHQNPPVVPARIGALAVVASAIGGAIAAASPTGTRLVDPLLCAALAVLVTLLASRAAPSTLVLAAAVIAATGRPTALALAATAVALVLARPDRFRPLAGTCLGPGLLLLSWPKPFGITALIATLIVAILIVGASPRLSARIVGLVLLGVGIVLVLACAGFAVTAFQDRHDLQRAVDLAERGLRLTRTGDTASATAAFTESHALLVGARSDLHRWWVRPARAVPVIAQHARALDALTAVAVDLVDTASGVTSAVDPQRLRVTDGTLDLAAMRSLGSSLTRLENLLERTPTRVRRQDSPWLLVAVGDKMTDLTTRASDELDHVRTAIDATEAASWLLGQARPRRYFLAVMTQSENRGGGGFVGNWGILTATEGKLTLDRFGRSDDLQRLGPFDIDVNPEWNARYVDGWGVDTFFPRNVLGSPDLRSNAEAIRQASAQAGLGAIDGVLAIDPIAMAELLKLTGPIQVPQWPEALTSDNAARILMFEQYLDPTAPGRVDFLSAVATTLFDRLTSAPLPTPARLADILGPLSRAGHLQLTAFDSATSNFLHRVGAEPRLEAPTGDSLLVTTANTTPSKSDWFLRMQVTYDVTTTAKPGEVDATLQVSLENTAPSQLPGGYFGPADDPEHPRNRQLVSVYTPFEVVDASVDDTLVQLGGSTEAGHHIYETFVWLSPGQRSTLRLRLRLRGTKQGPYRLRVGDQPSAVATELMVSVDDKVVRTGPLVSTWVLTKS